MNFLIIDTSSPQSFVALSKKGNLFIKDLPPLKQSQTLLPKVAELLDGETLDFIAVGTGPGSFTGTRVGVMTAKALAFAQNLPLLPFCSLKIFTPNKDGPFSIYGDGKSQGFYTLEGIREGKEVHYQSPTLTLKKEGGPLSETLNLPFLASYIEEKFHRAGGCSHRDVPVSYLTEVTLRA